MENVFSEVSAHITTESSPIVESLFKPKRSAYVFITTEEDSSNNTLKDLRKIEEVQELYLAKGAYDLVARVNGGSLDELREIISKRIRNIDTVKSTLTLTVI
jgi:DNA-binding Lrp family transcriptional regulator